MNEIIEQYDESQIDKLEGLEAVRKRPGMYIGSTSSKGLHHLIWEIIDNSVDEHLAGVCDRIEIHIHEDNSITVVDNGRGIPVGVHPKFGKPTVEVVLTELHAGGKFGGGSYKVAGGLHGVGASCVNALSEHMTATVKRDGKLHKIEFERGKVVKELEVMGEATGRGTTIWFKPDPWIFKETTEYTYSLIQARVREYAFLNPGLTLSLTDERDKDEEGNVQTELFCYEKGVSDYVEYINQNKKKLHDELIYVNGKQGTVGVEVALQYTEDYSTGIFSYANNIKTHEGGTQETGFKSALTKSITEYIEEQKLMKESVSLGEDTRIGLTAIISVKVEDPQFEGQTKNKLSNTEARPAVENLVYDYLKQYWAEHPETAKVIAQKVIDSYEERMAARKAREEARKKKKTAKMKNPLPSKLADCTFENPEKNELYLVEGDSAGGSAKMGRDNDFQAILPLRGKILNAEKNKIEKINNNEEIRNIAAAVGTGFGESFEYEKRRYQKIIIMTDADEDGKHIKILLLTFFFRYMRELVDRGHVYMARPPLYAIKKFVKGKEIILQYAWTELEKEEAIAKHGDAMVTRYKGLGEMNAEHLWDSTMDPEKRSLEKVTIEEAAEAEMKFSMLMGDESELRKAFIQKKAHYAKIDL